MRRASRDHVEQLEYRRVGPAVDGRVMNLRTAQLDAQIAVRISAIEVEASLSRGCALKIFVLGLFGSPNHGNEATLAAFESNMRRRIPGLAFVCVAPRQSEISSSMGMRLIPLDPLPVASYLWRIRPAVLRSACEDLATRSTEALRIRAAAKLLDGASALVLPGTGLIDDFGQGPMDMPRHLARWTLAARQQGIPVVFMSVGVSRVEHPTSRRLFVESLSRSSFASCRDEVSVANAIRLGSKAPLSVVPDMAFSIPTGWIEDRGSAVPLGGTVGVGVMGYFGWNQSAVAGRVTYESYLGRIGALIEKLLKTGRSVRLFTGDARADDATVAEIIRRRRILPPTSGNLIAEPVRNFRDAISQISACDSVVASRFHNVLFSIMLKKPVISIGYGDKNTALMAQFGLSDQCRDIESFDTDEVFGSLLDLDENRGSTAAAISERLQWARRTLDLQYDHVCEILLAHSSRFAPGRATPDVA